MVIGCNLGWQGTWTKAVYTGGKGPVCKFVKECLLGGSVECGGQYTGGAIFFT